MKKYYTLNEHKFLFIDKTGKEKNWDCYGNVGISDTVFYQIERFVKQNTDEGAYYLQPGYKIGYGNILKANQYVGVIKTKCGISVEILPKICPIDYEERDNTKDGKTVEDQKRTRKAFINMLKKLKDAKYKHFQAANMNNCKMPLLELFISMFLDELTLLVRKGIRSDYINKEENASFLKGKLKLGQQIKYNYIHKERFFISFDEYSPNRVENRLIKSTLLFLIGKTASNENSKRIKENLFIFDLIEPSDHPKADFEKVKENRNMKYYENVMSWCRLFLNNESVTPFKGDTVAFALLFDMNRIFEDYVAWWLKRELADKYDTFVAQDKEHHLIVSPEKYKLKPDIVINGNIILDTKWKLISNIDKDISQADLYQMYAYGKKYEKKDKKEKRPNKLYLIYPKNGQDIEQAKNKYDYEKVVDELPLQLLWFDCEKNEMDTKEIIQALE